MKDGIALIICLIVITLLSVFVIEYSFLSRIDANITGNWENERRAFYLAEGGVNFGIYLLKRDKANVDSLLDEWAEAVPPIPVDEGVIKLEINDEDGKININRLIDKNGKLNRSLIIAVKRLFLEFDVEPEVTLAILGRLEEEQDLPAESSGSDSGTGFFRTKGELEKFAGLESCFNCLTIYSSGKININTAPVPVLMALSKSINEELAKAIVRYRVSRPFSSVSQIGHVPGIMPDMVAEIKKLATVKSTFFTVKCSALVNESWNTTEAVIGREKKGLKIIFWKSGI